MENSSFQGRSGPYPLDIPMVWRGLRVSDLEEETKSLLGCGSR